MLAVTMFQAFDNGDGAPDVVPQLPEHHAFVEGFENLHAQIGSAMGTPLEDEHPTPDAEAVQLTSTGLAVYRAGQPPSFTDGWRTWALAADDPPTAAASVSPARSLDPAPATNARVECIIARESQGRNIANAHGSGAAGVAQYMPATFAAHAREMGHPEWSPWNPAQARAVAAHDLALGRRGQWTVSGC